MPALAAMLAGHDSLWAWPVLIVLVFPIAIAFAALGRHFPSAGGAAHFVAIAFGPKLGKVTGWLFLSVIPVGLPAALQIAAGFWQAMFGWSDTGLLMVQLVTLLVIWLLGTRSAGSSANLQTVIALLVIALVAAIWWQGGYPPIADPMASATRCFPTQYIQRVSRDVLVFCWFRGFCSFGNGISSS